MGLDKHILAVIPARAGSKGIPNKNIRIVGGSPLISYSINNALNSRYITKVVVTTDSPEVRIIAQQLGADVHWRSEELCADDVTLDAVVYDALQGYEDMDYVVTMQPTSPTLQVNTLDAAIEEAVQNNTDTLISVINDPRLSWKLDSNNNVIPSYTKRLNRQWLPAEFAETGAFVISKFEYVTPNSRFGRNVQVFEVSADEGIDIDNFNDLRNIEYILNEERVAIYVNGNNKRGIGHIYRALEMADEFYSKPDIYFDVNQTDIDVFGQTTHNLIGVDGIADLFERCKNKNYNIIINDILTTSIDYMIGLKSVNPNAKIINFEDDGEGIVVADLVFNALYHDNALPQVKAGERYYISSKSFLFYKPIIIKEDVDSVFICFGGADPQNYSDRLLKLISTDSMYEKYHFKVVLGRAKKNVNRLLDYNRFDNIDVLFDVSNMPEIMSSCDIGITSRGRTGYELAILGIPSIAMAQNHREEKHGFVCRENGFDYLGLNPTDEEIKANLDLYLTMSASGRAKYQDILLSHDLRNGRKRVMNLIRSL